MFQANANLSRTVARVVRDRRRRRATCGYSFPLVLALIVWTTLHPFALHAQPAPAANAPPWRVVILHNTDFVRPISMLMDQALVELLLKISPRELDVYGE